MSILLTGFMRKRASGKTSGRPIYRRLLIFLILSFYILHFHFLYLPEEVGCKNKIVEFLVAGSEDVVFTAFPLLVSVVDINNFFTDTHYRVHVVGVDEGGHIVFMGDIVYQFVDYQ